MRRDEIPFIAQTQELNFQPFAHNNFHFTDYFLQFRTFCIHAQTIVCYSDYA